MPASDNSTNYKGFSYEFFILAISILAIINIFFILFTANPERDQVLVIVNFILSLILLFDFFYRFLTAREKLNYFLRHFGWLDLLGSLPLYWMPLFRLLRIIRILRLFRQIGAFALMRDFRRNPAASILAVVTFLMFIILQVGSYLIIGVESRAANANIVMPLDALWWALVTVTTVGYGDKFPVTNLGRIVGTFVILIGVIMFSVLTSFFTSKFSERREVDSEQSLSDTKVDVLELHRILEQQSSTLEDLAARLERIEHKIDPDTK